MVHIAMKNTRTSLPTTLTIWNCHYWYQTHDHTTRRGLRYQKGHAGSMSYSLNVWVDWISLCAGRSGCSPLIDNWNHKQTPGCDYFSLYLDTMPTMLWCLCWVGCLSTPFLWRPHPSGVKSIKVEPTAVCKRGVGGLAHYLTLLLSGHGFLQYPKFAVSSFLGVPIDQGMLQLPWWSS